MKCEDIQNLIESGEFSDNNQQVSDHVKSCESCQEVVLANGRVKQLFNKCRPSDSQVKQLKAKIKTNFQKSHKTTLFSRVISYLCLQQRLNYSFAAAFIVFLLVGLFIINWHFKQQQDLQLNYSKITQGYVFCSIIDNSAFVTASGIKKELNTESGKIRLRYGDKIELKNNGSIAMSYYDGTDMTFTGQGKFIISSNALDVLKVTGNISITTNRSDYWVNTPAAVLGILGTSFNIEATEDYTKVELISGRIKWKSLVTSESGLLRAAEEILIERKVSLESESVDERPLQVSTETFDVDNYTIEPDKDIHPEKKDDIKEKSENVEELQLESDYSDGYYDSVTDGF